MSKYICIHGHFYQPPRENPWTNRIDRQPSAHPYGDWNQRIAAECYLPNGRCQIIGDNSERLGVMNNYAFMSFNFGPTLLSWLEEHANEAYQLILEADQLSLKHFDGHGSAMAQCYNHMIMPLANEEDQKTQVMWGVEDFKYRFGRRPEGMWLPETAVDLQTLDQLAAQGILFTILAPKQAAQVKGLEEHNWTDVTERSLNKQRPYLCRLPSGRAIHIFFYDGVVSGQIAFGKIIRSSKEMLTEIHGRWRNELEHPLFSIAVDGETFGHHRRLGDMALARLIYETNQGDEARMMNYAAYLAHFSTTQEVHIHEKTAWSSSDGLARWQSDGGGCIHHHKGWTQKWRAPLREAMDYVRDQLNACYENAMRSKGRDPWQARNDYIHIMLTSGEQDPLLEMQKNLMFMYTSCGWFFDDISGLEARQIMQYAARAMAYAKEYLNVDIEEDFLKILEQAQSNVKEEQNGRYVYEKHMQTLERN